MSHFRNDVRTFGRSKTFGPIMMVQCPHLIRITRMLVQKQGYYYLNSLEERLLQSVT